VVPGGSWARRLASVVARCPGAHARVRPVISRLLVLTGIGVAGWLLGTAGAAHADTVPGARLPSVAVDTGPVVAIVDHVLPAHRDVVAVPRTVEDVPATVHKVLARPPAFLALPPAAHPKVVSRPRTPAGTAGPSRTRRHGHVGSHARIAGRPVNHTGRHAAAGASEKAPINKAPSLPRRAKALPPPAGSGVDQTGVRRRIEPGTARRPAFPVLRTGAVPPAVRTAADEPTFSPD
jgi:hypothetical protein